jgi:hypothetical protein
MRPLDGEVVWKRAFPFPWASHQGIIFSLEAMQAITRPMSINVTSFDVGSAR